MSVKYRLVESGCGRANLCHIFDREHLEVTQVEGGLEIKGETASGRTLVITATKLGGGDYSGYDFESSIYATMDDYEYHDECIKRDVVFLKLLGDGFSFSRTMLFVESEEEEPSEYFIQTLGRVSEVGCESFLHVESPIVLDALNGGLSNG